MDKGLKRIAIISRSLPPLSSGGTSSAHYHLFRAFREQGHEVKAFTFRDRKKFRSEPDIARYGAPQWMEKVLGYTLGAWFRLRGAKGKRRQLLEILCSYPALRINFALMSFRPDVVIFPDHGAPALYVRKIGSAKFIWVSHHNPGRFVGNALFDLHDKIDAEAAIRLENMALKKIDIVVCPSFYMKNVFAKTYDFQGQISVIPNIFDESIFNGIQVRDIREELGLSPAAKIIYIPSAGSVYKGADYVFEIIRRLHTAIPDEIGFYLSGRIEEKLAVQIESINPRVHCFCPGQVPYEAHLSYVRSCSVCVSPSLVENLSMAFIESLYFGVPVVAFAVGGNSELVRNGETGHLVGLLDIEAMLANTIKIITEKELGINDKEKVAKNFYSYFSNSESLFKYNNIIDV